MSEDRRRPDELYKYLDGKFGDLHAAFSEHREENIKDITTLKNKAETFDKFIDERKDDARDRKNNFWLMISANVTAWVAIIWHAVKHLGSK